MINIIDKADCCGCGACAQICPKQCISMQEDNEGFLYPKVELSLCIDCSLCETVCPIIHQGKERKPISVLAGKNRDENIRLKSSSGGIFTLIAQQVIENGGVVFGAKFDKNWEVVHDYCEDVEGLKNFRGSKYVQSRVENSFSKVEYFLKENREVLFSGTPCQIAGLKNYLRKDYDNLLCVDIVCHGTPSPKVWRKYLDEIVDDKSKITSISFRDKIYGWKKYSFSIKSKSEFSFSELAINNIYLKGFLSNIYLRPSCSKCSTRKLKSGSDVTIADYWGIEKFYPKFSDDMGIGLILVNTDKGNKIINNLSIDFIFTSFEEAKTYNPSIIKDSYIHKNRRSFFKKIDSSKSISKLIEKNIRLLFKQKLKLKIYAVLGKIKRKIESIIGQKISLNI